MASRSEAALELALTQPVLPLDPAGKKPLGGLGLRHATRDPETVRDWWRQWPVANVGARCDGLCVIDVDGDEGEASLERLQGRLGRLPASRVAKTGKGRHLFYVAAMAGNSTRPLGNPAGIDLRGGNRGYVVCPPSLHPTGVSYQWLDKRAPAPLPPGWLQQLARQRAPQVPPAATHILGLDSETAYGRKALESELERLLRARDGERNEVLNHVAFRLAQLVAGNQLPLARVEQAAADAAVLLGLDPLETKLTIQSAVSAGLRFPRAPRAYARARESSEVFKGNGEAPLKTFEGLEPSKVLEVSTPALAGSNQGNPDYPDNPELHPARASKNALELLDEFRPLPRRRKRSVAEVVSHIRHERFSVEVECFLEREQPPLSELDADEIERLLAKHADIAKGRP